jgi:hypothetical protein
LADILITSPSAFSYMAGILCNGLKLANYPWWHDIPERDDWIRVEESHERSMLSETLSSRMNSVQMPSGGRQCLTK